MASLCNHERGVGVVPTVYLMPWAFLAIIGAMIARIVFGVQDSLVLWMVLVTCVAILLVHGALLIAYTFGWTVWNLLDRAPKPSTVADRDGLARDDEDTVA